METFWFFALTLMIITYAVLDGFDLGAGIVHLIEAKTDEERRTVLNAIGPFWDGNEVWLIASGGVLYFAFPQVYASAFSGLYLPLMMILWLLMLRALGIELRRHFPDHMWVSFWDFVFSMSSLGLTVLFGAALGNVIRGVPLDDKGWFFAPLWTNFQPSESPGVLDWFTVLFALSVCVVLACHGACFVAHKTEGELCNRSRRIALRAWAFGSILVPAGWAASYFVRPRLPEGPGQISITLLLGLCAAISWIGVGLWLRTGKDTSAFLTSCSFIAFAGASIAVAQYPVLLHASSNPSLSLTAANSATSAFGMKVGLVWWIIGMALVSGYFVYLYYTFRGKIGSQHRGHY